MTKLDSSRPWDLTTIQRLLMGGFKEGARLAAVDGEVREHARDAAELPEAFAGATRRAAEKAAWRLGDSMAADFPERWGSGAEPVVTTAIQAALVLGARAIAAAEEEGDVDLKLLAEDELWLAPEVDRLLIQVVEALSAAGFPLPGARSFLGHVRPCQEPEMLAGHGGTAPELRTGWISDADSGRSYQWCLRREADVFHLSRRRRGSRGVEAAVTIPGYDLAVVGRLLRSAATRLDWL